MQVTDSPAVWRAVAHPVRRRLVELLADGPRTTGDLAKSFPVSRFAVMKHLAVLHRSGMVSVRRQGRERWNALTIGSGLELSVGAGYANLEVCATPVAPAVLSHFAPFRIEQQVIIRASAARVFDGLTFNVSAWWGAPYVRSARATNVVLEPQLGGRFFEEWGHRQGFIRGVVTAIGQDERLELAGRIAGAGCLPAVLEIGLHPDERGTRLALVHRGVEEREPGGPAGARALYESAWEDLVGVRLKAFVERGARSGISERPPEEGALFGWF
jgi:DNA-binding transcriptional ArsR family regulator/uncharacterized protein YndB with AHSA1/START domain